LCTFHMRGRERRISSPFLFFVCIDFASLLCPLGHPIWWHPIRTFGSSGSSVLTQGYRTEHHQVHIAALCLVP
jgi:hypothetical protein